MRIKQPVYRGACSSEGMWAEPAVDDCLLLSPPPMDWELREHGLPPEVTWEIDEEAEAWGGKKEMRVREALFSSRNWLKADSIKRKIMKI